MKKNLLKLAAIGGLLVSVTTEINAQWLTTGNALGSTGFLGTTSNQDVSFITNNTGRLYLTKNGNFGIGTNTPTFLLDVYASGSASANFKSSSGNANLIIDRGSTSNTSSVSYRTGGVPTWQTGTVQTDNFSIRNIALTSTALTILAANSNVGIGTAFPATTFSVGQNKFNVAGADGDLSFSDPLGSITFPATSGANSSMIQMFASGTLNSDRMVIAHSPSFPTYGLQYQDASDKFNFLSNGTSVLTVDLGTSRVGVGNLTPFAQLDVVGAATAPVISATATYVGSYDVIGVSAFSKPADGFGYGVNATGGYFGGYFNGDGGAYTGTVRGVYGYCYGTAGSRYGVQGYAYNTGGTAYGVYGSATGNTTENSWGGYFPTKTYTNELRVGTTSGATGYVACFGGKVIATEVRVQLQPWPDYVFAKDYDLMSIAELEASIATNQHLPGLPAACDVEENGLPLGEMQGKVVEKLEEAHLYIIQLQKQIDALNAKIDAIKK